MNWKEYYSITDSNKAISSAFASLNVTKAVADCGASRWISICSISPENEKNSWISLSVARSESCFTCTVLDCSKKLKNQTNTKQQILTISNQLHQNFNLHNRIQTIKKKKIHLHCLRCLLRILHSDPRRTQIHSGRYFTWSLLRKQRPVRGGEGRRRFPKLRRLKSRRQGERKRREKKRRHRRDLY